MSNPLVNEGIGIKVKKKFGKRNEDNNTGGKVLVQLIGMNKAIDICAEACACCWDKQIPDDYAGRAEYVAKRARIGHTSVLEHSNYVLYMSIDAVYSTELIEFLTWCNYLNTKTFISDDKSRWHLVIGGSYRGFADIYRETDDLNNPVLKAITGNLYTYANSAAFEDICKEGLMDKSQFKNIEPTEEWDNVILTDTNAVGFENELFKIIGLDNISKLYSNLYNADKECALKISTFDLIKFATVSVLFKDMSRTGTHQLVRHRNGITQESQRYVDYSKACFSSPEIFKPDKYDKDHKYTISFGPSGQMHLTLSEIGKAICDIYGMLSSPNITGNNFALLKEDARAFLPGNVQCKKIYITFTFKNLFKFLNLREDKAAQAEIRRYAVSIGDVIRENTKFSTKEVMDLYTKPRLLVSDPFSFDENLGETEEVIDITEEDYMKATGLDAVGDDEIPENDKASSNLKNGDEV